MDCFDKRGGRPLFKVFSSSGGDQTSSQQDFHPRKRMFLEGGGGTATTLDKGNSKASCVSAVLK